jgi:hypothetical protein
MEPDQPSVMLSRHCVRVTTQTAQEVPYVPSTSSARVAWPMGSVDRAHLVENFGANLGLVRFADGPQTRNFGYCDHVLVLGLNIKRGQPCLTSYLIATA